MKKISLFALWLLLVSCQDSFIETNLGNQPLHLSASAEQLVLDITADQSNAVTFDWTSGSNFNTNAAITYTFELGPEGAGPSEGIKMQLTKGRNSVSYKTGELNALLLEEFGIEPYATVTLAARVTARVHSDAAEPQVSETLQLKVTTYKPVSSTLYLVGGAAPNGWNVGEATPMNGISGTAGGFVWQGMLSPGELKFVTTLGSFTPSYNKGSDNSTLILRESDDQPDEKFIIPAAGIYRIQLNIINLRINIEALDAPDYGALWFVGHASGWSFQPMTLSAADPFVFLYNGDLKEGGEFKIATAPDFGSEVVFLRPEINNQGPGTGLKVVKWSESEKPGGTNDYKWNIPGGVYKIRLDTRDMKIDIVKFAPFPMVYLVGDATPNGWDIGNATAMTATTDPNRFVWTGNLKEGEVKFSCDRQTDWGGAWFVAPLDGAAPTGDSESMLYSAKGSVPDNKWKVTSAGRYTIELDQLNETVKFTKQ